MKLNDLIKTNSWISVEIVFRALFPDELNNLGEYEKVFNELKIMVPVENNITILLNNIIDEFDNEEYVDVNGYNNDGTKASEFSDSLALEFTPWDKWLGMEIDKNNLIEFSEFEIICHCLFEMTFIGFDQDIIEKELEKLNGIVEEIENMSDAEKEEKLIPFEKIKEKYLNRDE